MTTMNDNDEKKAAAAAVRAHIAHTTGSDDFYPHPLRQLVYTDGVRFVAETCGAYWLIDAIASHQPEIRRKLAKLGQRDFQCWVLNRTGTGSVSLDSWTDTPGESEMLSHQSIEFSDFPDELIPFDHFWVENGTLMLRGER